jgi:hypothetical protein
MKNVITIMLLVCFISIIGCNTADRPQPMSLNIASMSDGSIDKSVNHHIVFDFHEKGNLQQITQTTTTDSELCPQDINILSWTDTSQGKDIDRSKDISIKPQPVVVPFPIPMPPTPVYAPTPVTEVTPVTVTVETSPVVSPPAVSPAWHPTYGK